MTAAAKIYMKTCCLQDAASQHHNHHGHHHHSSATATARKILVWAWIVEVASLLHCAAEGAVSITLAAIHGQLSLLLFGLDSVIEVASGILVLWHLSGRQAKASRERIATGGIGTLLLLLCCAAIAASTVRLVRHEKPDNSLAGLVIGSVSAFDMICFFVAKRYLARKLSSRAIASDATCSLVCCLLGVTLIIGSAVYIKHPSVWWIDAAAALVLCIFIAKEGVGMVRNACSASFEPGCCC